MLCRNKNQLAACLLHEVDWLPYIIFDGNIRLFYKATAFFFAIEKERKSLEMHGIIFTFALVVRGMLFVYRQQENKNLLYI